MKRLGKTESLLKANTATRAFYPGESCEESFISRPSSRNGMFFFFFSTYPS